MAKEHECIGNGKPASRQRSVKSVSVIAGFQSSLRLVFEKIECLVDVMSQRMSRVFSPPVPPASIPKEVPRIGLEMSFGPIKMLLPLFKPSNSYFRSA